MTTNVAVLSVVQAPVWFPTVAECRTWRGSFCIPNALPGIPYGDGKRIWTPAYGCYDAPWRKEIRDVFRKRRYTHFEYQISGFPYAGDYPELAVDPQRVVRDLTELLKAGCIPNIAFADNRGPDLSYLKPVAAVTQHLVPITMGIYEFNGVFGNDTDVLKSVISQTVALWPKALHYIHFTAGHGSIGFPENEQWKWCAANGVIGLLSQDWDFETYTPQPKEKAAAGLEDTARHLHGEVAGWEGLNLDNVAFEQTTTATYHQGMTEAEQIAYGDYLVAHAPSIAGFCDGGTA